MTFILSKNLSEPKEEILLSYNFVWRSSGSWVGFLARRCIMRPVAQPPHCQCRDSKRSKAKSHLFLRSIVNLQRWKRNLKSRTCLWSVGRSNSIYAPSLHTTYLQHCGAWSGFQQQGPIQGLLIHIRVFVATRSSDFHNSFHDPAPHFLRFSSRSKMSFQLSQYI